MDSIEYQIGWIWKEEAGDRSSVKFDYYKATTAPRAIAKFLKAMEEEYGNARSDLRVLSAFPKDGF